MKILYITSSFEDYLQDQTLIGLRELYGDNVIDYPKKDVLYKSCNRPSSELYGCGFSIWKCLPEVDVDRENIFKRARSGEFDFIIFGSIWRQKPIFKRMRKELTLLLSGSRIVFLDGEDYHNIYKQAVISGKYFKRELFTPIRELFVNKISFSIPDAKINQFHTTSKDKTFAKHVQCDEAYKIQEIQEQCQSKYAFSDEEAYYRDIARSYYAVTMKKGGWDCMRHNEIGANGTVPCFYRFSEKPKSCAPHGLIDMENIVAFNTADELTKKIELIKRENRYEEIRTNIIKWARYNSCKNSAERLMASLINS